MEGWSETRYDVWFRHSGSDKKKVELAAEILRLSLGETRIDGISNEYTRGTAQIEQFWDKETLESTVETPNDSNWKKEKTFVLSWSFTRKEFPKKAAPNLWFGRFWLLLILC